jgi:D-alanyl-D-alanine dipeptidase
MNKFKKPIPIGLKVYGWERVLIEENHEKLVEIRHRKIIVKPQYFLQRMPGSIPKCYVRERVAELLNKATKHLLNKHKFIIYDGWRPFELQNSLFKNELIKIKNRNPNMIDKNIKKLAQKYVSLPSKDVLKPSPHITGGAIDISIIENDNLLLDMGTNFDYFGPEARTDHYESLKNKRNLTKEEEIVLQNRRFLYNSLYSVGFTNYPEEWWHFDYGNQFWGRTLNTNSIYGKIDQH